MTERKTQSQEIEAKQRVALKKYLPLVALAVALVLLLFWAVYTRPTARANRALIGAGLAKLPDSTENLMIETKGNLFSTRIIFIMFNAMVDDVAHFVNSGLGTAAYEPTPLRAFHLGPKLSSWMKWNRKAKGRVYHTNVSNTSIWLAIDVDTQCGQSSVNNLRFPPPARMKSW